MKEALPINSLTRRQLVSFVAALSGLSKSATDDVLTSLSGILLNELCAGRPVRLPGIGRLVPKRRQAKTMTHPRTGEPLFVHAKTVVVLRPQGNLTELLAYADQSFD